MPSFIVVAVEVATGASFLKVDYSPLLVAKEVLCSFTQLIGLTECSVVVVLPSLVAEN